MPRRLGWPSGRSGCCKTRGEQQTVQTHHLTPVCFRSTMRILDWVGLLWYLLALYAKSTWPIQRVCLQLQVQYKDYHMYTIDYSILFCSICSTVDVSVSEMTDHRLIPIKTRLALNWSWTDTELLLICRLVKKLFSLNKHSSVTGYTRLCKSLQYIMGTGLQYVWQVWLPLTAVLLISYHAQEYIGML